VSILAGVTAITAVYIYFLLFAEFAFLEHARRGLGESGVTALMVTMGLAGIGGSLVSARRFRPTTGGSQLAAGFVGCAVAALLSLFAGGPFIAFPCAALVGGSLGWTTVTLSLCLRPTLHLKKLGFRCGLGTGLAYAFCNQPLVFTASPQAQIIIALLAAFAGFSAAFRMQTEPLAESSSLDYRPLAAGIIVTLFFFLVWLDSAAFFIIQHNPLLKAGTWENSIALQGNAFVHLCAAVLTGFALDRRQLALTLGVALLALMAACIMLAGTDQQFPAARVFYTAGVSIYSTALVFFPARGGRPRLAGILFAVAGWFGSAAGIGMAQSLNAVPLSFVLVTAVFVATAFIVRGVWIKRARAAMGPLAMLALALFVPRPTKAAEDQQIIRGREVYISEGCIHCHSQYVRPQTMDELRWGPSSPLAESLAQNPPLFGNRRQGPDLAQVGNRRSPEWNRLHLIGPRLVSPGSRMPSYAHLFRAGDPRGDALLAYLASLGGDTLSERLQREQAWSPLPGTAVATPTQQRALFQKLCVNCHGAAGHGDGELASKLSLRPPDFSRDVWRHVHGAEAERQLTRIVKFGLPGTAMSGHEYLSDSEVVSLATYALNLHVVPVAPQQTYNGQAAGVR
jgi:cytochrome c oxidase cbb3-type subunit 2